MFLTPTSFAVPSHLIRPQKSCEAAEKAPTNRLSSRNGTKANKSSNPTAMAKTERVPDIPTCAPSPPVVIPSPGHHNTSVKYKKVIKREENNRKHVRKNYSPNHLPLSSATLLANTSIPPWRKGGKRYQKSPKITKFEMSEDESTEIDSIFEKSLYVSHGEHPLEVLLSPPDTDGDSTDSENSHGSFRSQSSRASYSCSSISSIGSSSSFKLSSSPGSSSNSLRKNKAWRTKRVLAFQLPTECLKEDHPLYVSDSDSEGYTAPHQDDEDTTGRTHLDNKTEPQNKQPRPSFKSNISASLRALKRAAKSISSLATPITMPDDFLTRSIIHVNTKANFPDERIPPCFENEPTPDIRRYLNPSTNAPIEIRIACSSQSRRSNECTASIQMHSLRYSGSSKSIISQRHEQFVKNGNSVNVPPGPITRQREVRENSDFMRVAVIEMSMRKLGKLNDQKPGRARYALPPRKMSMKPYEVTEDGVPLRWVPTTL